MSCCRSSSNGSPSCHPQSVGVGWIYLLFLHSWLINMKKSCPLLINFVFHHNNVLMKLSASNSRAGGTFSVAVMVLLATAFWDSACLKGWGGGAGLRLKTCLSGSLSWRYYFPFHGPFCIYLEMFLQIYVALGKTMVCLSSSVESGPGTWNSVKMYSSEWMFTASWWMNTPTFQSTRLRPRKSTQENGILTGCCIDFLQLL